LWLLQARDGRFTVDAAAGTLTIRDVRLSDEGNYVCVVNTSAQPPVTSTNAHLYVESELATFILPTALAIGHVRPSICFRSNLGFT